MSDLSELGNNQKLDKYILNDSSPILEQLKEFIANKNHLFDYYRRHKNVQKPSKSKIICDFIRDFFWKTHFQKILTFFILICFSIFSIEIVTRNVDKLIVGTTFLVYLILSYVQFVAYLILQAKVIIKDIKKTKKWLDIANTYDPNNHINIISNIGEKNSAKDIKIEEQRFKIIIISQTRAKALVNSAIPLVSFLYVLFGLFVFGSPQDWGINLEPYKFLGVGIVYLIIMLFSFFVELMSRNLVIYQHCLLILQEALTIAEKREKNNKLISVKHFNEKYEYLLQELKNITKEMKTKEKKSSINKNIKGKNLFKELKTIKIVDAPRDFSTNFD